MTQKGSQNGPKMAPKSLQVGPKIGSQTICLHANASSPSVRAQRPLRKPIWDRFGTHLGSKNKVLNHIQFFMKKWSEKCSKIDPKMAPKPTKNRSKNWCQTISSKINNFITLLSLWTPIRNIKNPQKPLFLQFLLQLPCFWKSTLYAFKIHSKNT